jgi:hypothetical protein
MTQPTTAALPAGLKDIQDTVEKSLGEIQGKLKGIEQKVQKAQHNMDTMQELK